MVDPQHFYLFAMCEEREYRILARRSGDDFEVLDQTKKGYRIGKWHQVRMALDGPRLAVYIDGEKELEATDKAFQQGTIALYCWGSPSARFRKLTLKPKPGAETVRNE